MLGDILLIQDKHKAAGEQIIDEILKRKKSKEVTLGSKVVISKALNLTK